MRNDPDRNGLGLAAPVTRRLPPCLELRSGFFCFVPDLGLREKRSGGLGLTEASTDRCRHRCHCRQWFAVREGASDGPVCKRRTPGRRQLPLMFREHQHLSATCSSTAHIPQCNTTMSPRCVGQKSPLGAGHKIAVRAVQPVTPPS